MRRALIVGRGAVAALATALAIVGSPAVSNAAMRGDGSVRASWPSAAAGAGTCTDAPLTLDFPSAPTLGKSGRITVTAADGTVADTIDLADPASSLETVGGAVDAAGALHEFHYFPVIITGSSASIYLHHQLDPGRRYTVSVDAGVFPGFGARSWGLRTKARTVPPGARRITVDAAGHGDFCTVQGAIDAVPFGNTRPVTIDVAPGTYTGIDWVPTGKAHITVQGAGPGRTVVQYANNNTLNSTASATGGICPRQLIPGHDDLNCWRASFNVEADDFTVRDLTLRNTTPYQGSQAEAFRGNGDRIVLDDVRLLSFQDTLRLQGRGYVTRSYIEGDVDFTWGFGAVMIADSELKSLHAGYITQVRNDTTHPGYVFLRDRFTAAAGVADGSVYLGRIDPTVYPASQAVFIDSALGPHVAPAGWLLNNGTCTQGGQLQFWEYGSVGPNGTPVDTGARLACSRQLAAAEAARWSDPGTVLSGWEPDAAARRCRAPGGDGDGSGNGSGDASSRGHWQHS